MRPMIIAVNLGRKAKKNKQIFHRLSHGSPRIPIQGIIKKYKKNSSVSRIISAKNAVT